MTEETIGERLTRLRETQKLSKRALGKRSGVSREYITQVEGGKVKTITLRMARRLAKGLGKPPEVFFQSPDSESIQYRSPSEALSDIEVSIKAYIPVYAEVSAGEGVEPIDYVACTRTKSAPESLRAYRVNGLCLEDEIKENDTLVVDTELSPTNDDLVIVIIDDEASVKRYREDGKGKKWLENNHGKYQPEDCHLHGVVIEYVRRLK